MIYNLALRVKLISRVVFVNVLINRHLTYFIFSLLVRFYCCLVRIFWVKI